MVNRPINTFIQIITLALLAVVLFAIAVAQLPLAIPLRSAIVTSGGFVGGGLAVMVFVYYLERSR